MHSIRALKRRVSAGAKGRRFDLPNGTLVWMNNPLMRYRSHLGASRPAGALTGLNPDRPEFFRRLVGPSQSVSRTRSDSLL